MDAISYNNEGFTLYQLGEYDLAMICFDRAIKMDPKHATATYNNKGLVMYEIGEYKEAIGCFDKALSLDPYYGTARNNKGLALLQLGEYAGAVACFDVVIDADSEDTTAQDSKGAALLYMGKYKQALKCFERVLETEPTPEAYQNKRMVLQILGKHDQAAACAPPPICVVVQKTPGHSAGSGRVMRAGTLDRVSGGHPVCIQADDMGHPGAEYQ